MDEAVRQALARWPDVPDCFGWLSLSRRGEWQLPDGPIRHAGLAAFIGRNYEADADGRWYFQNGPQRVFVSLAYTPTVLRLAAPDACRPTPASPSKPSPGPGSTRKAACCWPRSTASRCSTTGTWPRWPPTWSATSSSRTRPSA
jgi:hypothetical protein